MARSKVSIAASEQQLDAVRELLREYESLLRQHHVGPSFDKEIAGLPGEYAPPHGVCLLVEEDDRVAGCVVLRRLEEGICEMRRLYIRPEFRGRGLGRMATLALCREARRIGYHKVRLLSMLTMTEAIAIYRSLGFREIKPYRPTTATSPLYMEGDLSAF